MHIVYCHTNKLNGKKYVGFTHTESDDELPEVAMHRRWLAHCAKVREGSNGVFHNSIRKNGLDVWDHNVLETHPTEQFAKDAEIRLIAELKTYFFEYPDKGYNMTRGGDGSAQPGELNHFYGKKHSEETRQKIREARARQVVTCSEETAKKISESNLATMAKMREDGRLKERALKAKITLRAKREKTNRNFTDPVEQYSYDGSLLIAVHNNIREACISIGKELSQYNGSIGLCCDGKQIHAYGFVWKWVNKSADPA